MADSVTVDDLAATERRKYEKMWAHPAYRKRSPGQELAPRVFDLLGMQTGQTVIDYGCGEGRALEFFRSRGIYPVGVDIVALRHGVIEACLWDLPTVSSEWAFCADVLEHLPPEKVDDALRGIRERTRRGAAFSVTAGPDGLGHLIGEQLHLTIRPATWWQAKLEGLWDEVVRYGHSRCPLFICGRTDA